MARPDPANEHLKRLRGWRNRPERDVSMNFLRPLFKREVEKPHKQLADAAVLWQALVPAALVEHTRLESLQRGILRVGVDSSSHLYELDGLLRQGLERELIAAHRNGPLRKVQLRLCKPQ